MAEFHEVMWQLNRMCSHYQNCGDSGCPIFDECGNIGSHSSNAKQAMRIEERVMTWAAEHPEPVYPTWGEWFVKQSGFVKEWENATNPAWEASIAITMFRTPISADIAQKLGIEPKEG